MQKPTNERVTLEQVQKAIEKLIDRRHRGTSWAGVKFRPGDSALRPPWKRQDLSGAEFCQRLSRRDLRAIRHLRRRTDYPVLRSQPAYTGTSSRKKMTRSTLRASNAKPTTGAGYMPQAICVAGGELTLGMLDLRYDREGHYYEAPLHMKALGGCFLIDDFGRQLVSPAPPEPHGSSRWRTGSTTEVAHRRASAFPFEESSSSRRISSPET